MASTRNLYMILDVAESATFAELKRAYYTRAKACHPDRYGGSQHKEEEFKQLVSAFNVLSDPDQRHSYDEQLRFSRDIHEEPASLSRDGYYLQHSEPVMDAIADDILEELVVGNHIPLGATLQTLMRDLESTEKFIRFREGKNLYHEGRYVEAFQTLQQTTTDSPGNILYHYFLGICAHRLKMNSLAAKHLQVCLQLGAARVPPQRLDKVRRALHRVRSNGGLLGKLFKAIRPPPPQKRLTTEEEMLNEMNRALANTMRRQVRREQLAKKEQRRLTDRHSPRRRNTP